MSINTVRINLETVDFYTNIWLYYLVGLCISSDEVAFPFANLIIVDISK